MLGFFDSGLGGLSILRAVIEKLPRYSTVYLGDNARTPYGSRAPDQIHRYTLEGVMELFGLGAELIVLACNTSSSVALRKIQQEYLPLHYPDKRVLGIIIPTAEEVTRLSRSKKLGILATQATVSSLAYPQEIYKIDPGVMVFQQACPLLVPMIEAGEDASSAAVQYVENLLAQDPQIDTILLGCTHYALIEGVILKLTPPDVQVVSQGTIVAEKLADYLRRHPEMERRLDRSGKQAFLSTECSPRIEKLATQFFGAPIAIRESKIG